MLIGVQRQTSYKTLQQVYVEFYRQTYIVIIFFTVTVLKCYDSFFHVLPNIKGIHHIVYPYKYDLRCTCTLQSIFTLTYNVIILLQ